MTALELFDMPEWKKFTRPILLDRQTRRGFNLHQPYAVEAVAVSMSRSGMLQIGRPAIEYGRQGMPYEPYSGSTTYQFGNLIQWPALFGFWLPGEYARPITEFGPLILGTQTVPARTRVHTIMYGRFVDCREAYVRGTTQRFEPVPLSSPNGFVTTLRACTDVRLDAVNVAYKLSLREIEPLIAEVLISDEQDCAGPIAVLADFVEEHHSLELAEQIRSAIECR